MVSIPLTTGGEINKHSLSVFPERRRTQEQTKAVLESLRGAAGILPLLLLVLCLPYPQDKDDLREGRILSTGLFMCVVEVPAVKQ